MNLAQELDAMVIPEKVLNSINKKLQVVKNKECELEDVSYEYGKNLFHNLCKQYKKHYLSGKEANGEKFIYTKDIPHFKYFSNFFNENSPKLNKSIIICAFIGEAVFNGFGKSIIDDKCVYAVLGSNRFIITIKTFGVERNISGIFVEYDLSIEFGEIKK